MMNAQCKVKICGITNADDLHFAAQAGADYAGALVEIESSPRNNDLEQAQGLFKQHPLPMVAVTLNRCVEENLRIAQTLKPDALQLHGDESTDSIFQLKKQLPCELWKTLHLPAKTSQSQPMQESGELDAMPSLFNRIQVYAEAGVDRFLIDASLLKKGERQYGGTGKTVDWQTARLLREKSPRPLILAGGLTPQNAVQAVTTVQPYAIDVSSGVEAEPGRKDYQKIQQLCAEVLNLRK